MILNRRSRSGFSLAEVALALGLAAFCLVALFGLLPVGLSSNQASIGQTTAASVARGIVADLRVPQQSGHSPYYQIPLPTTPRSYTVFLRQDGSPASNSAASALDADADATQNPKYRATVSFYPPATGARTTTAARVLITWPALADSKASNPPSKYTGSSEVVTAFNCN